MEFDEDSHANAVASIPSLEIPPEDRPDCDAMRDTVDLEPCILNDIVVEANTSKNVVDDLVAELCIDSTAVQMLEDLKADVAELSAATTDCLIEELPSTCAELLEAPVREEDSFDSFKAPLAPDNLVMSSIPLEEDSQSSFKAPFNPEVHTQEEDSQGSVSSQKSIKKRWEIADLGSLRASAFRAENLFEYQWPAGGGGEYFILQEQISEYLGVKSFKRKYPDLHRRQVDMDEKEFLKERGVVTETQCDLGLTALRSDEVIDLMVRDYFEKYQEYERVLHEKEKLSISEKHREYSAPSVEKSKMSEFIKRSVRSAADWNFNFNRERNEERNACFDLQTNTIHYPLGKRSKSESETTHSGVYPLALIPGQFQEYYRRFTQVELKYLPVNTVLYGPRKRFSSGLISGSDGSQSDSEDSSCSEGSSSGSTRDGSGDSTAGETTFQPKQPQPVVPVVAQVVTPVAAPKNKRRVPHSKKARLKNAMLKVAAREEPAKGSPVVVTGTDLTHCRICQMEKNPAKDAKQNEMIHCSICRRCAHSSCLDFTPEMVATIKTYRWQCGNCKMCMYCLDPYDEDKMMFCDKCDRGYHTFCVGLKTLPSGPWVCFACGRCGICGTTTPGAEGSKAQWFHEYSKAVNGSRELKQTLCLICSRMKRAR